MGIFESLFLWAGKSFTSDAFMLFTKIQGMLWSMADIVVVWALLKISDLVRVGHGLDPIRVRYNLLILSGLLTPGLLFFQKPFHFFILESVICGIQFLILGYTVIAERKRMLQTINSLYGLE